MIFTSTFNNLITFVTASQLLIAYQLSLWIYFVWEFSGKCSYKVFVFKAVHASV